jgi:chemosensory pili system protein ChpA (sensor histidine kinase/response regulator)
MTAATEAAADFDLGPLSWVQGEIDSALGRGLDALATFRSHPGDATTLKHARMHVHQAAGAIQMVGLDAVVAFTDEIERQLARLEQLPAASVPESVDIVDRACRKLRIFLDELVNGAAPVPLKLYPEYEAMQRARGVRAVAPTDLFYPDLAARAPRISTREALPQSKLPSYLIRQRRQYQRGLLSWLRGDAEGAKTIRDAIAGIEDVATHSGLRSFWWSVGALFESVIEQGVESGFGVKQLAARIDLQIRRVGEGSSKVADRLRREVLYYVAISAPVGPQVQAVQRAFKLSGLIPTMETIATDVVGLQPLVREAREQLAGAKDTWLKFASGRAENLPKLKTTLTSVHTKAAQMKHGALMKLTSALVERLDRMPTGVSEPLAMEYATALLLAESAFENFTSLSAEFPQQVDQMISRLDAARSGRAPSGGGAPMLDEMSRRAQERVLLAQVGREIQTNLRHMEQVIDAFFRDNSQRADLATLTKDSTQIRGALKILGLDEAERLLAMCQEQIEQYADPAAEVDNEDLELLAESLSGLGFYVEAVEQQRPDRERLIAPLIAKRTGERPTPVPDAADTVEDAVEELRAALPALLDEVHRSPDASVRDALRAKLVSLRDDAELIGDAELVAQADAAVRELDAGGSASLAAVVGAIAETSAPAPELSAETQRLLEVDAHGLDAELLDIYLTEAGEVLDTIRAHHAALEDNHGDREALRTVRRGFHTLKGSGRMVGLTELGEFAYDVEKIHNRLLDEERPVTAAVLEMIVVAEATFRGWVDALRSAGRVRPDPAALHAAIRAVEAELPGRDSVIGSHPAPAAPALSIVAATEPGTSMEFDRSLEAQNEAEASPGEAPAEPEAADEPQRPHELPVLEALDLGEVGDAGHEAPHVEVESLEAEPTEELEAPRSGIEVTEIADLPTIVAPAFHAPTLKLVADNTRPPALTEAIARAAAPTEPTPLPESPSEEPAAVGSDDITIGDVTLAQSLWQILVDEAGQHLTTLDHELSLLQFDPHLAPTPAMIRASHTLCGIHRTGGFQLVAALAKAFELALSALEQRGAPLPTSALPLLGRATHALRNLVQSIRDRKSFLAGDEVEARTVQDDLDVLRQDVVSGIELDAETAAAHAAAREDEAEAPQADTADAIPPDQEVASDEDVVAQAEVALPTPIVETLDGISDEIEDRDVLQIFLEESAELFPAAGEALRAWRRSPHDGAVALELRRTLHTFKGSARMAGAMRLGELTHLMEARLIEGDGLAHGTPQLFDTLETDLDRIAYVLDKLRVGETNVPLPWVTPINDDAAAAAPEAADVATSLAAVAVQPAAPPAEAPAPMPVESASPAGEPPRVVPVTPQLNAPVAAPPPAEVAPAPAVRSELEGEAGSRAMLRVRAETIDRLVNEAGEVAIARARVEGELRAIKSNLLELTNSVIRLRSQVREIEIQAETQIQSRMTQMQEHQGDFDPLEFDRFTRFQELTRSLVEGVNDVSTVQQSLLKNLDDADAALLAQARLSREVQQKLFAIRTVPFGSLADRLYRIVRSVARELDKRANLEIAGAQTELDRSVLEKLAGPLEHLLRNALDHGIESREARIAAGKPETGEIALTVRQAGNEIFIELTDDGAGIDLDRIRDKARASALIAADAQPTERQLLELIFQPGFSTASKVTAISGRGVGMDVVRAEIGALGGRVEVGTEQGLGTQFTLSLPLTLAVAQAVLVRAGGRLWALPAPMVEQVQQVRAPALLNLYERREVEWQQRTYPFHYLPRLLGDTSRTPETQRYNAVLLLKTGQGTAAVHVDEMIGNQEIVVKNIGPQLARVSGVGGATVLGTGEIVLIINPVQLAQRAGIPTYDPNAEARATGHPRAAAAGATAPRLVLVVDDSLTVRKITSRLLAREGFRVATAKDGIDALQSLGEEAPDLILLDIEMPRMDGFEFTKTIKADPKHAHVPIIMITSRTADKHRARARELGIDLYLGKPFQEEELLRNMREMLGIAVTPA